ncbi:MAG: peptide chain release factor 1 [Elusimicrobiota bacterium]
MFEKLQELKKEFEELEAKLTLPEVINNNERLKDFSKRHGELAEIVHLYNEYLILQDQYDQAESLYEQEDDVQFKELAEEDMDELSCRLSGIKKELKAFLIPKDPDSSKDIIMEIRAGTGGDEAALFCAELFRMYARYAENKGWKLDIYDLNKTGLGGYKEVIFAVEGKNVFSFMKWERGIHRVQRVPETETSGRIHTSACSVAVFPQADQVEIQINKEDLRIDTYRASGKGGQHVNVTDSAVRITHIQTGLVVQCQDERSQMQNKLKAMNVLRARLKEKMKIDRIQKEDDMRRKQVGSGDRSEKIRTYNFPQNRITDHRAGLTVYNLESIIEGNIEDFLNQLNRTMTGKLINESENY